MKNSKILNDILSVLQKEHVNLYHDITKEDVVKYVNNIKNIDDLSSREFDYELLKLFALFKDAHTSYKIPYILIKEKITFLENKFYVFYKNKWKEIVKFGNIKSEGIISRLENIINFETIEWRNVLINDFINNHYVWEMLKIADIIELESGDKIPINIRTSFNKENRDPYEFKIINNDILYVRYTACIENPNYKFKDFVKDIKKQVEKKHLQFYILDLRNNMGGSSEILNPFQNLVRNKNIQGVLLINNGVISSGRFAVARFKKEFNTPLIGQPTGGAAKSYGYTKLLEVDGKTFSVSIRLWDFSKTFGYEGAIQPDVPVKLTIDEISSNKDKVLDKAVSYIYKEINMFNQQK